MGPLDHPIILGFRYPPVATRGRSVGLPRLSPPLDLYSLVLVLLHSSVVSFHRLSNCSNLRTADSDIRPSSTRAQANSIGCLVSTQLFPPRIAPLNTCLLILVEKPSALKIHIELAQFTHLSTTYLCKMSVLAGLKGPWECYRSYPMEVASATTPMDTHCPGLAPGS